MLQSHSRNVFYPLYCLSGKLCVHECCWLKKKIQDRGSQDLPQSQLISLSFFSFSTKDFKWKKKKPQPLADSSHPADALCPTSRQAATAPRA